MLKELKESKPKINEFKEFALKGNVVDLAVGVIIGAAFGKIVSSLVEDVFMPPLAMVMGKVDFSNLFVNLSSTPVASLAAARKAGVPVIAYGAFLNSVINFIVIAFAVFLIVKQINRMRKGEEPEPTTHECPYCFSTVSLQATRCPHCTSQLESVTQASPVSPV